MIFELFHVKLNTLVQRCAIGLILTWLLLGSSTSVWAQNAGVVEFSRGVGFAQSQGQMPRTLGKGLPLNEGDRLTTSEGATAIIKLNDGTRMTLRPHSEIVVQHYQYNQGAANSMIMQLLRGGFRAITGLITKNAPNAAKIRTVTATVGIRGTDFDARLCGSDCKAESAKVTEKARPNTVAASAKLISAKGDIEALDFSGAKRVMVEGASVYSGDTVVTGADAKGVLVFRDDSRLTLGPNTRFKIDSFVYDEKNPSEGNFLISLLRGSMRALTGVIGKINKRNVSFKTPTATVGIRGTGLDLDCREKEDCRFFTWLGIIDVMRVGQTDIQTLTAGQGLWVSKTQSRPLTAPTLDNMQRPDQITVNVPQLFSSGTVSSDDEGLFVFVRDGHIEVTTPQQTLHLGRGETGYAGNDGRTGRPAVTPLFIQFDKVPMPNQANPMLYSVLGEVSQPSSNQCR